MSQIRLDLPSLAAAPWLVAGPTQRVLGVIAAGGFEARCVGGVVRNALMGLAVTDIDVATNALPQDVVRLARAAGLAVVETGLQHGTVTVIADHHPIEVTTLRRDVATHGRHATVAFTDDWAEDARRRDFTMNALYCDADGAVLDPLGGLADLTARRVRFIGSAADRIREDYLRIMRFFRFTAQYGEGDFDADGLVACAQLRMGLGRLSRERIHQEMVRLLVARRAVEAITIMQEHGVLAQVLPAAPRPCVLARLVEIEQISALPPEAMLRLAALAVVTPEDASRIGAAFKVSRAESGVLELGGRNEVRIVEPPEERTARALLYREGPADYARLIQLAWAGAFAMRVDEPGWERAVKLPQRWAAPRLPVSGADVMAHGIAAGPRVGEILRAVEDWWIANDFTAGREELLSQLALHAGAR